MFEKLPDELKEEGHFCLWRYERRKGRLDKVPYRPDGRRADATDIKHYVDFSLAADAFISSKGKYSGIGLGVFKPFGCIDGDACYFDSTLSPMAQDVTDTMDTYTESSPSGTGVCMVFRAAHFHFDAKRYYINNRKIGLEAYAPGATGRFCTITGNCIRERGCEERSAQFEAVLEKYMVRPVPEKKAGAAQPPGSFYRIGPSSAWRPLPRRAKNSRARGMASSRKGSRTAKPTWRSPPSWPSGAAGTPGRWTGCSGSPG